MGSGTSRSKISSVPDNQNSLGLKNKTSRPTSKMDNSATAEDVNMNDNTGSTMAIDKFPSNIDDVVQNNVIRKRLFENPCVKNTVLPRLNDLVRRTKKSCRGILTIQKEYGNQLEEIINLIKYETSNKSDTSSSEEEKQERPPVVSSYLADVVNKLGIVWTLSQTLKLLKSNQSIELEDTIKTVRKWAIMLCTLTATICMSYKKCGILKMFLEDLQNPAICKHFEGSENTLNKSIMVSSIIIVDISAMRGVLDHDEKIKLFAIIHPYARCNDRTVRVQAVLSLCSLQSENGQDKFLNDDILVKTLFDAIQHALDSPDHQYADIHLQFLLNSLAQLASRDCNHSMLVSNNVMTVLKAVLEHGNVNERKVVMNALWSLSFNEDAKEMMRNDSEMMSLLNRKCNVSEMRNAAEAVKKQICEKDLNEDESELKVDEKETSPNKVLTSEGSKKARHVMISYQWDTQEILLRVRDRLKENGYVVWMDVDNIEGSTLQSMAEAVEEAAVVLICYSHRYKSSPNARTEAEYAFQLRKDIIPLKMEENYQADGWLGAIIGTKLYIEVDPEGNDFDTSMQKLTKELGSRGKNNNDEADVVVPRVEVITNSKKSVANWGHHDVSNWANQNGIKSRKLAHMVGEDLVFLKNLRKEAPEYFYNTLESKVGIISLQQIRVFTAALKNL
ncbi:uncharacterized protein [Antedon mediterranea]|uniref:uncharacterized protein n=1 Tax=Antedon mediterranea TaxID=105859 RepID=UPI003AF751BA